MANQTSILVMVLLRELGSTALAGEGLSAVPVKQFALHNVHAEQALTAKVSKAGGISETEAVRSMHIHDLLRQQSMGFVVINTVVVAYTVESVTNPYTFHTNDGVPAPLCDIYSSRI